MTHELILTSVAQGLESEGGGFCVVAADSRFPESLIENLFQLSDYRYHTHHDSKSDSDSADSADSDSNSADEINQNPIIYSYTIIRPAAYSQSFSSLPILSSFGKKQNNISSSNSTWHVLSRIAPSGKDYQNKPNRLAHHIVLSEDELVVEGPAWLLALSGFHFTQWYTPPINFPSGRPVPTISLYGIPPQTCRQKIARERLRLDSRKMSIYQHKQANAESIRQIIQANEAQIASADFPISPCPSWKEITGDAGWGGVLAESARYGKETVIIYPKGMNLLPLFVESLAIVPVQFIWNTTFTTYFIDSNNTKDSNKTDSNKTDSNKTESNKKLRSASKSKQNSQLLNIPYLWKGVVEGSPEAEMLKNRSDILLIDLTRTPVESPEGIFVKFAITGAENDLPVETNFPTNSEIDKQNTSNTSNVIIDPINQQSNDANSAAATVPPIYPKLNSESGTNAVNLKKSDQPDLANLKFDPNTDSADLSLSAKSNADSTSLNTSNSSEQKQTHQPPPVANIITKNILNPHKTTQQPKQNISKVLNRLLRNLSKNQFYLLYAAVSVIIVGLLILVIDQIMGFGAMQSLFGQKKIPIDNPIEIVKPIITPTPNANGNINETKPKNAEQIKAEQKRKLEETLTAINNKFKKDRFELDRYIRQFNFPSYLPLNPPEIKENKIIVPKEYFISTELAALHQYGSALKIEWISLWDFNNKKIETRRLKFNIGDPKDQNNNPENEINNENENENENKNENENENEINNENVFNKTCSPIDKQTTRTENSNKSKLKHFRYRNVNLKEETNPEASNKIEDEIVFPDSNRFEWEVVAVIQDNNEQNNGENNGENNDNNTADEITNKTAEVKLFHLKLEENGLHIKWERSGLLPDNFHDTLRVALGFLRFSVEPADGIADNNNRNDKSEMTSEPFEHFVQLFKPQLVSSISPHAVFTNKTFQFPVSTPFVVMPWSILFNDSEQFKYRFNLEVEVLPNVIADISTNVKKDEQLQNVEIEFTTTKIDAKRRKLDESNNLSDEKYFPLQVKFTAEVDKSKVMWTDIFQTEIENLTKNLKEVQEELKNSEKQWDKIRQQIMNIGNAPDKIDERKKLENNKIELEQKRNELSNYKFETESRIDNLPKSHSAVMSNNEIQFDYSVYLTSGENKRELLIMTTSNNLNNEKINKK